MAIVSAEFEEPDVVRIVEPYNWPSVLAGKAWDIIFNGAKK